MNYTKYLFSPVMMGILFILFAVSMAVATFIENDFGSAAAYNMVYNSVWFELILILLAVNLVGQLIIFNLFRRAKLPVALFHIAFILMIIGAGITRYTGWEGSMHIREGEEQNIFYSGDDYITYSVKDRNENVSKSHSVKYSMTAVSAENFSEKIIIDNSDYELVLSKIIQNAERAISENSNGAPIISLLLTRDMMTQESIILNAGDIVTTNGISIGFLSSGQADVRISFDSGIFYMYSDSVLGVQNMNAQQINLVEPGDSVELKNMQIVTVGEIKIVPKEMMEKGIVKAVAVNPAETRTGENAFIFDLKGEKGTETIYLWDNVAEEVARGSCVVNDHTVEITYGAKESILPFSIMLKDFVLDRYPGSNSPSGYKSDVILIDKSNNITKPFMIFMNNVLKYEGYRFYQSSYDMDEKGTILSVNHDMAGMLVTYSGYTLLIVFIILALISKEAVFHNINAGYWNSRLRKTIPVILLLFFLSGFSELSAQKLIIDKGVADEFGKVLVQDQKGRTEPLYTLSSDILRKVTREHEFEGFSSMQVFMGIYLDFNNWKDHPIIMVSNTELRSRLGVIGKYAAFSDLVDLTGDGSYKLSSEVNEAYAKSPGDRSRLDKEIMKVDERLNIVYMIYKGDFLKLFPLKDGTNDWGSSEIALQKAFSKEDSLYLKGIIPVLTEALLEGNMASTKQVCQVIKEYQTTFSKYDLPSESRTKIELLYYKLRVFERLFPFYATIGLIMLISLIIMVIRGKKAKSPVVVISGWFIFAGFLFHTLGLGMRWYISGHSPMSNGYESMIFISWVTLLAGFIFSRKSAFALSATGVLASMTLMVAHLSFMDPEITNLVPVLKSYWLTLHVSVITGSYGFLGLGAILGLINLILLTLSGDKNREQVSRTIDELSVINFKSITLGLYLLTIGTFLGAVWANESWGRYWGWDPKETWSLITIIIYSIVTHSRMIPGMKDIFTFNLISLFAFSSVLMTYFGVNYYLSGLHSYAGGDPVPVPVFVYVAVIVLTALSFIAYSKYSKFKTY